MSHLILNNNQASILEKKSFYIFLLYLVETITLLLVALELYKISILFIGILFTIFLIYWFYNNPFALLPIYLLSILAGSFNLSGGNESTAGIPLTEFFSPIVVLITFIKLFHTEEQEFKKKYIILMSLYGGFLIWSFFTIVVAVDKTLAFGYWRSYFTGFIVFIFAFNFINNYKHIKIFILTLIIWGIVLAFNEFYILFSLGGIPGGLVKIFLSKNLLATSWGRSNYLAAFYVLIIPISVGYFFYIKSFSKKIILTIVLLIMFSAIVLTLSRGGLLSLTTALILLLSKLIKPKTFIPILSLFIVVALILILNPFTMVIYKGLSNVESSLSYFSRLNFYEDVWKTFLKHPITGVGLANLGYYSVFKTTTGAASAHNIILGTLGETGIVGSILFISLLALSLIRTLKNFLSEKFERIKILQWSFFCGFIGVFVHSMMEPNFEGPQFAIMFWSTFAVFIQLAELNDEEKSNLVNNS